MPLAFALTLGACDSAARTSDMAADPVIAELTAIPTPAVAGSGESNLTVGPGGGVYLSWLEPSEAGHALRFATLEDGGWTAPRTVIDRPDLFVNWADFPSLAVLPDGTLAAHWLEMSGPGTYSYDVRMAFSRDGGQSWGDDVIPHTDGIEAEHGFVSLVPLPEGDVAALWLDGRATPDGDPMTLRFAIVAPDGSLADGVPVDGSVCDCCQTAMAATADGLVAAYRDRTADEVRDIYVTRYVDGGWTEGRPVHDDGWVIAGCPVNGPSLSARGDTVVVAWFTAAASGEAAETREEIRAAGERGRTLAAFSTDGGATFGPPVRVDDGDAMGRVDVELLPGGGAAVAWLERTGDGAEIRVRRVEPSGVGPAFTIAGAAAERATGFPRMVRAGDRLVFSWTAAGDDGGVRTGVAELEVP